MVYQDVTLLLHYQLLPLHCVAAACHCRERVTREDVNEVVKFLAGTNPLIKD